MKQLLMTTFVIFGLAINSNAQVPNYVPSNGLLGWWPFNGNANDESGNGNNGTPFDGAFMVSDRFGISNSAFSFSGPSYIEIPDQPSLRLQTVDFTINAWVEAGSLGVSNHIFIKDVSSGCGIPKYNFGYEYNKPWFHINDIEYECNGPRIYGSPLELSGWTNIMLVKSGFNYNFYINGVLNGTEIMSNPVPEVFASARIGGPEPNGAAGWIGKIDDVGIWNRALTQEEISNLYNATNCSNNLTISPATNQLEIGSTANFVATTSDTFPSYVWQSDFGQGYVTLNNYGNYSGANTNSLSISNVQLPNHTQPIRAISTSGECIDTSNVATINITDTCIVTINDTITTLISVTDTLVINTLITGLTPPNNSNTIKVFPNPANSHITIDFGNFESMNGYTLTITNSIGQTVYTTPINEQSSYVDLSTWSGNGIYFVQIIDTQNNIIENRKIVLQ